ncbi:glycosyltransferase [uncultured Thiodictyon sp.]|uniref:glycosyltransferase n=1 Tax=uncultured Thiodictyon sp. TaxID=1846217 RepID=UPI0025D74A8D|nr:glycosyltransferase [uncultured Thiodictyon sp.]
MIAPPRLAIYCGPFDGGSTAKIAARLANGFVNRGVQADLLVTASRDPIPETTDPRVRVVPMGRMGPLTRVPAMALYLRGRRPTAVLTHRIREDVFTLKAARLARAEEGPSTAVYVTVHGRMSVKLDHLKGWKGRRRRAEVLNWYRRNRGIVAISQDTAQDLLGLLGEDAAVTTIPNPIVTPQMLELAQAPIDHPWFGDTGIPVLVFAGRLEIEKDLPTLLRAFAQLRAQRDCRLLIIGDGRLRPAVEAQRAALGLTQSVEIPGWAPNPYPYLRQASLVVLSSIWDALPTVLIESLALGTPVVSTECGAGPREILDGGRFGPLVPPGDVAALADAMARTLANPLPAATLRQGGERYEAQRNADLYLELMLGQTHCQG